MTPRSKPGTALSRSRSSERLRSFCWRATSTTVRSDDLDARRRDGRRHSLERDLAREPVLELHTDQGELKIVPEPAGTRGYDDLRRAATREPLGHGLRPSVASVGDHARMLAALDREHDRTPLLTLRRLIELERERSRGLSIER